VNAFIGAASGFRKRGGFDIEIDVNGDEEVEVTVPVV